MITDNLCGKLSNVIALSEIRYDKEREREGERDMQLILL